MIPSTNGLSGRVEMIRSQTPGVSSESPTCVQGPKNLDHPSLFSQPEAESWSRSRAPRTRTITHMGMLAPQGARLAC